MLNSLVLHNFKSHRATQLILDSSCLHALVGQNSSGKTSVLQALHYLSRLTNSSFDKIFQDESSPEFITTIGQDNMSVTGRGYWGHNNPKKWEASYKWQQSVNPPWFPTASWKVEQNEGSVKGWSSSLSEAPDPIPQALRYSVHLKLVANNLAKAAYSNTITPRVEFDGSGLAPTLDYLRNEAPDKFQSLQEMLQRIVPGVQKVGIKRSTLRFSRKVRRSRAVVCSSFRVEKTPAGRRASPCRQQPE